MNPLATAITDFLIRARWPLLVIALIAGIVSIGPARRLDFDRTINTMFAEDDPLIPPYRKLQRIFGDSEVALAVYDDPQLLSDDKVGIRRLANIRRMLEAIPGVTSTMGLDSPISESIVDPDNQLAPRLRDLFVDFTHGADGRTVCVACILAPRDKAPIERADTVQRMRDVLAHLPDNLAPGILAGEPVMMADAFLYVEQDGKRLFVIATVLMGAIILVFFRSLRWVIIPIVVVQLALVMTKACLYISQIRLTMVSSMLTAIVTVIGVATVVHLIVRFRDVRQTGLEPLAALRESSIALMGPIFWSCVTDAVGFASLGIASVAPVRNFGTMMAIGSMMVLLSVGLTVGGLVLLGRWGVDPGLVWGEGRLERWLRDTSRFVERRPVLIGTISVVFTAVSMYGMLHLETETDFTRNFRDDTEIVKSYEAIEARLGGAGLCDILVPVSETVTWPELRKMMEFEDRLRREVVVPNPKDETEKIPGLTKVISLADAIDHASPTELKALGSRLRRRVIAAGLTKMQRDMAEFYSTLRGVDPAQPDQHYMRVMLRARERQPSENKRAILAKIDEIKNEMYPADKATNAAPEVTGYFVLLTNLIDSVVRDQWSTFAIAVVGIFVAMVIAFGNLRYAFVALIPNCFPILVVSGLMGWLGLHVNMGAAMIAAVSVGLSVDSSIHYIRSFQFELLAGHSTSAALETVQASVGRAVIYSTLALVLGFVALCTSPLIPTVYFGVLVSLSMLGGLVGNLIVLPLLLKWVTSSGPLGPTQQ